MNTETRLEHYAQLFADGRRGALLDALALCAQTGTPMPQWLADAWLHIYASILEGEPVDLNKALGFSLTDPRSRKWRHIVATRGAEVGNAILREHRAGKGISVQMFEEIAETLGLTVSDVRHCYNACRAHAECLGGPFELVAEFSGLIRPVN